MQIIPVIDLARGDVVHARQGQRAQYAPLRSTLLDGSDPHAVLAALLHATKPPAVYIADLDAICRQQAQTKLVDSLAKACPVPLWVDAGYADASTAEQAAERGWIPVIGTETLRSAGQLTLLEANLKDAWILSLDGDAGGLRGDPAIWECTPSWPTRRIAMELPRVGSEAGPLGVWLQQCMATDPAPSGSVCWIAAGGVRHADDLAALEQAGVGAALVATALHNGTL